MHHVPKATTATHSSQRPPTILFYDRSDARTRHLVDAADILSGLRRSYRVETRLLNGTKLSNATLLEQAATLFNSHPLVITVHGAHLFNMLHAGRSLLTENRGWGRFAGGEMEVLRS